MSKKENVKGKVSVTYIMRVIVLVLSFVSSAVLIYYLNLLTPTEPMLCYIGMGVLLGIDFLFLLFTIRAKGKKKLKKPVGYFVSSVLFILICLLLSFVINYLYNRISVKREYLTYSTSLVTLVDSPLEKIEDVDNLEIGIVTDNNAYHTIAQEMIEENKLDDRNSIIEYEDFPSMLNDLFDKEIDAVFLSSSYGTQFQNIFEDIVDTTKVIATKEKEMQNEDLAIEEGNTKPTSLVNEPFTILLLGVDSKINGMDKNASFNGDSLILITFNPKTLTATTLSIPRDSYVPIACFANQKENKITHAAWNGASCMMKTIEGFTGIDIDYYVKVNFKAVVSLVDALGGVEIDVPYSFCEQNSDRKFGKNTVYVKKGLQTLNGEEALAYARNRKAWPNKCSSEWNQGERSDIIRGLHQQEVIQALLAKVKDIRSIDKIIELLDLISSNIEMNMTQAEILSFYNVFKDIAAKGLSGSKDIITFQQLFLKTSGQMIYDESMKLVLSDQIINQGSLEDVIHAMKVNLELEEKEPIKTFSFSINNPYTKTRIGDGNYSPTKLYALLPDFTGKTKAYAESWGNQNGIKIVFSNDSNGVVKSQNYPAKKRLDLIPNRTVTLTLEEKTVTPTTPTTIDCSTDPDNSVCTMPNFVGKGKQDVTAWASKLKNVTIKYNELSSALANGNKAGTIVDQSIKAGESIRSTTVITFTIVVEDEKESPSPSPSEESKENEKGSSD